MDICVKILLAVFVSLIGTCFCSSADFNFRLIREFNIQDVNSTASYWPMVQTLNGLLRGFTETSSVTQTDVDVFLGIPFAKPPLNNLRFRKPEPVDSWQEIYNATQFSNSCIKRNIDCNSTSNIDSTMHCTASKTEYPTSEDCLYLNLWVPKKFRTVNGTHYFSNATVMIWIHGGAYTRGSSNMNSFNGLTLAAVNDVIVVTLNYRLGAFGFLYLGTDEAPGNMGLYDQAMAFQWIKNNIHFFGGNPNSITVFGESAGAGSISAHLLSPVTGHLIKRAILQSGVVNAPWSYTSAEKSKRLALNLAKQIGCNDTSSTSNSSATESGHGDSIMQCLKNNYKKLYSVGLDLPYTPTIDGVFLPDEPKKLLKGGYFNNSTEILLGNNLDEGTFFIVIISQGLFNLEKPTSVSRGLFFSIINTMGMPYLQNSDREALIQMLTTKGQNYDNGFINQKWLGDIAGDFFFVCPQSYFAQKFADGGSNVYYYYFTQKTSNSPWGSWVGVPHASEIEYVFGKPLNTVLNYTEAERQLSRKMMKYFTNFAKTGKPIDNGESINWPKFSRENQNYFTLNADLPAGSEVNSGLKTEICTFWNEVIMHATRR